MMSDAIFSIFWTKIRKCEKKRTYFHDIMILSQRKAQDRSIDFEHSLPVLLLCRKGSETDGFPVA